MDVTNCNEYKNNALSPIRGNVIDGIRTITNSADSA